MAIILIGVMVIGLAVLVAIPFPSGSYSADRSNPDDALDLGDPPSCGSAATG